MKLFFESCRMEDYLVKSAAADYEHPIVQEKISWIRMRANKREEQARLAFRFVRDEIGHSFDRQSRLITISASDSLRHGEGICFSKAHTLAALLRGLGVPAGFCYQRVTRKGTPESGFALHGLNALYLAERDLWIRVDPRGDKPGIHSEFGVEEERLAYPIRPALGEVDYPYVFVEPPMEVIASMEESADCGELFHRRPERLNV